MMALPHFLLGLLFIATVSSVSSSDPSIPFYTAVSSKIIRPFSTYNVTIFVEKSESESPIHFTATVNSSTETYNNSAGEISVIPGSSSVLTIPVQELKANRYNLTLQVRHGSDSFENKSVIYPAGPDQTILIQTDKPVYKPGETVRFRVVLLDRDLKPQDKTTLKTLKITDAEGNIIKVWKDQKPTNGLFKAQLELSKEPVLGSWQIKVEAEGQPQKAEELDEEIQGRLNLQAPIGILPPPPDSDEDEDDHRPRDTTQRAELSFSVDQYVLPKFEVTVKPPPFAIFNETRVPVQVTAKYTYGKGVNGQVTLRSRLTYDYSPPDKKKILATTKDLTGGSAVLDVDLRDLFSQSDLYETEFTFEASVTENVTGIVRNGTATMRIHRFPFKIDSIETSGNRDNLKPGLPFKISFRVTTQDGKPFGDPAPDALKITHGFSYRAEGGSLTTSIPSDGVVNLTFDTPTNELLEVQRIQLDYKGYTKIYYVPPKYSTDSHVYMQVTLLNDVRAGESFRVLVNSTKTFEQLNYVISNGQEVLKSLKIDLQPKNEQELKIECPSGAGPEARLLVFAVLSDGDVVGDSAVLKIGLDSATGNFLNVTSVDKGEPGDNVTLKVTSSKNSLVALRGVDQSILLVRDEDTDITQARLDREVKDRNEEATGRHRTWGGSSTFQLFDESGLSVISNTKVGKRESGWNNKIYYDQPVALAMKISAPGAALGAAPRPESSFGGGSTEIRVRSNFPETWIWEDFLFPKNDTTMELTKTLPDTLTSWVITGFSLNRDSGIAILQKPTKITTIRPFFLSLNLPYSVVKGETLVLQVLVHNYLSEEATVEVTLDNAQGEFQFAEKSMKDSKVGKKVVSVQPNTVTSVEFPIVPLKFGSIMLNAKGVTGMAGDALSQPLRVKPPGQRFRRSVAQLLTAETARNDEPAELTATFPSKRVEGADQASVTVIADILGQTAANLDKLLNMPTGCGEQNMLNFVADIVVLDYLKSSNSLVAAVRSKALRYLETGYQRELTYKHPDGSYSAFGTADTAGSTWLTAFVVRSFIAAKPHIYIDDNVINSALKFLANQQQDNGAFYENGKVLHSGLQGGSNTNGVALTAYVAIALIEASQSHGPKLGTEDEFKSENYTKQITKALDFIVNKTQKDVQDPYALVITTYALHLANHSAKDEYFERLEKFTKTEGGFKYWTVPEVNRTAPPLNETEPWHSWRYEDTKPVAVEMTGYGLLTYLLRDKAAQAFPIVRWLLRQRNSNGGFISTQDTVVGLTALAEYAKLTKSPSTDLVVTINDGKQKRSLPIKDADADVLNQIILSTATEKISASVEGKGSVLVAFDWEYYVEETEEKPAFDLKVTSTDHAGQLKIRNCVKYLGGDASNMAIVEVNLPSGYAVDRDSLDGLKEVADYKRYDLENGDSRISVYFDTLSSKDTCFSIGANRIFKVGNQVAAYVRAYDYYDTTKQATTYYEPPKVSICDVCQENDDCDVNNCI